MTYKKENSITKNRFRNDPELDLSNKDGKTAVINILLYI